MIIPSKFLVFIRFGLKQANNFFEIHLFYVSLSLFYSTLAFLPHLLAQVFNVSRLCLLIN